MKTKVEKTQQGKLNILRTSMVWLILITLLVIFSLIAVAVGSARYSLKEIWDAFFNDGPRTIRVVILSLRLPRVILALLIGSCLSAAGALLQAVMKNPLADPGTIGVSAGAGTAAITILLLFPSLTMSVPLFAFLGAGITCLLIYTLAWKEGVDPVRIILSGVAVNSVLGSYNAMLQLMNSNNLEGVLAFMSGSLAGRSWSHVRIMAAYAIIGLLLSFLCMKHANALQLGDEMAKNLGVRVNLSRICLSAVSAFLAAATVSVVGMIGFVGLVVPHIARMLVGSDYKIMLPTSMLLGAVTLVLADTIGRTIIPGMEIPVGIIMGVAGGPFFLYMLRKRGTFSGR
jgi:ABC-type Fe3+-siderophore transport system, permease component